MLKLGNSADANVQSRRHVVTHKILKNDPDFAVQRLDVVVPEVHSVQEDGAAGGIIQPRQQLDQRGLALAVLSHQGHVLAGLDSKVQIPQHRPVRPRVLERNVAELNPPANEARNWEGSRLGSDGGFNSQEFEQIREEQCLVRDAR